MIADLNVVSHSFAEEYQRRLDRRLTQIIYEAVQDGLTPWKPGRIALYIDEHLHDRSIAIKVESFPSLVFRTKPDWFLQDATRMMMSIAEKAFNFYRYREALPVDDHVILGED